MKMGVLNEKRCKITTMECPICFQEIDDNVYTTSCNHKFCKKCIKQLSLETLTYRCHICRNFCSELLDALKEVSIKELYKIYCDIVTSEESNKLIVSQDLYDIIGFILITENKGRVLLNYLLNDSDDIEFKLLYKQIIVEKKRYFEKIEDPIRSFALALLYKKYH
jgi:hypothetical protein